jgi:CBS domain-containing protein
MPLNNWNTLINQEFPELSQNRPLYWLKQTNKVAKLDAMMDIRKIRHVPIIEPIDPESDQPRGELLTVISKTDLVKILTPPKELYPPEFPLTPEEKLAVASFSKGISAKRINQIPEFVQLMTIPVKTLSLRSSTVGDVFKDLINPVKPEGQNFTRRYRTLCVYGDNQLIVGTISYTDVLRKINDYQNYTQFLRLTIGENNLFKKREDLTVLTEDDDLLQARSMLNDNDFTHIPITTPDGRFVTGIVDDIMVNAFLHDEIFERYSELPLKHIMLPLNERNSVSPETATSKVIETFVPPNSKDRPTALVVCTKDSDSGKFTLDGIISYTDIFRGFQNWANPPKFPTPKPENKVQDN